MKKIKMIIIFVFVFMFGFISFSFAANYHRACSDGTVNINWTSKSCESCNWIPYDQVNNSEFYHKCCQWTVYKWNLYRQNKFSILDENWYKCCAAWSTLIKKNNGNYECKKCSQLTSWEYNSLWDDLKSNCAASCTNDLVYEWPNWVPTCCNWIVQNGICIENNVWNVGINVNKDCLLNGQCSMNVYKTLWIRKSNQDPSVKTFAQDIILWASFFFGSVMTIIFIISGLSFVMAWYTGKSPDKAKKMMVWSIIWLLLVTFSYTIIRLIQFLATWWS